MFLDWGVVTVHHKTLRCGSWKLIYLPNLFLNLQFGHSASCYTTRPFPFFNSRYDMRVEVVIDYKIPFMNTIEKGVGIGRPLL